MSQESSSTQLCEVLIDCYQDKEKNKHDQNGHDNPGDRINHNESDEDPLQKHLNAPFMLLRRPASKTNEVSFQFGKAKKTNFDFTGRVKGLRGAQSTDDGDGLRGIKGAGSVAGNVSAACPSQTKVTEPALSKAKTGEKLREASAQSVAEFERTLQDEEPAFLEAETTCKKIEPNKPGLSQRPVFHEASSVTNHESQANQDDDPKGIISPLEYLEKSAYFGSLSNPHDKESSKVAQGQQSIKHQDVPENEAKVIDSRSQAEQSDNQPGVTASMQYPKFNLLANRLKKNDKSVQRGQKKEKKPHIKTDKVFAPRASARVHKPKAIRAKKGRDNVNSSQMSSLQIAIDDVVREAYAEELNAFTIEREHFVAQVAALKSINSNLNSDLNRANKLHHRSTEGLKRLKDKVSARSEQIEELRALTDDMRSDLIENRCAFNEVRNLYDGTQEQLKSALSSQEGFSEASKRTSSVISELKESVRQLISLELNNKHLHEQLEEKNNRLTEEKQGRSALDQQLQRVVLDKSNVTETNTLIMSLSQRLEEICDNMNNAHDRSSSENDITTCLQAIRSLQEQQKFHSGYVMHAGAELQNLSRSVPIELQRIERLFMDGPWKSEFIGKLEEHFSEFKAQLASLTATNEHIVMLNGIRQSLQQQCSVREIEIVKLQAAIESHDTKYEIANDKIELLETEINNIKQASAQKDLEISRMKDLEASSLTLQHELNIAVEEKARLATSVRDKSLTEANLRSDLERLQDEKNSLEEKIKGFDQEKLNIETKAKESFVKQKEDLRADVQRLFAERLLVVENKLFNSNQESNKLQLALDNTCEELVDLKLKNKELSDKLRTKEDNVQKLVNDLHTKTSVYERTTASLDNSINELQNKDQLITQLVNDKEKAEAETQILREELQAFKLNLIDERRANEENALEPTKLRNPNKNPNKSLQSLRIENIDNVRENCGKGEGAKKITEGFHGQVAAQQYPQGLHSNLIFNENDNTGEPRQDLDIQGHVKVLEGKGREDIRPLEGFSTGTPNNDVPVSGQWPEQVDDQSSHRNTGMTNVEDEPQPVDIAQGNNVLANDNELISYFHSSNFSSGLLGTPSLFNLYTNKEQSQLPQNNQKSAIGETCDTAQNETTLEHHEDSVADSQMDARTFSDFKKAETTAMVPSSISALSDLDITTPEDFSTRPGPASTNRAVEENALSPRPRSSNMSARRRPSKTSPSFKGSDVSSEHVRNVGPEDVFQIDRKRPNPNTASKLKTNIFRGRGEGKRSMEADCCLGGDVPKDYGESKKRRLDRPPYLMNQFSRDSSSLPVRGFGLASEATGSSSKAGQSRVSKSQPRIKRILNWASMYQGVQQQQQKQQQNTSEENKDKASVLEQKTKLNKQRITESNNNQSKSNDHAKESRAQPRRLIQPKSKQLTEQSQRKNVIIEKSATPKESKASLSAAAKFEHLQRSSSTHVSATPGRVGGKNGGGASRTKRRRMSKNNRYSFRFSQETSKM